MISNIIFVFLSIIIIHVMLVFPIYMSYYETQCIKENNIKKYKFSDTELDPLVGEYYISKMMKIVNLLNYNVKFIGFLETLNIIKSISENENNKDLIVDDFFEEIEGYIEYNRSMNISDYDIRTSTMEYIKNKYINL